MWSLMSFCRAISSACLLLLIPSSAIICQHSFFFFDDPATPEIYTLSLHDALPIPPCPRPSNGRRRADRRPPALGTDRKSTRLNSSHRCISYAVFCLKKKKKKKKTIRQFNMHKSAITNATPQLLPDSRDTRVAAAND